MREVREETGLTVTVRASLGDVTYWYRRSGRRVRKTVRFFLCDFVEGSTDDHDHEVTEARWIPLLQARGVVDLSGRARDGEARDRPARRNRRGSVGWPASCRR